MTETGSKLLAIDKTVLLASPGYQTYLDEQMHLGLVASGLMQGLARHSLWDSRDANATAREKFDRRYGLVLRS